MKAMAFSVWIFVNLVCFGMCGYIYLIWSQYWLYLERQKSVTPPLPAGFHRIELINTVPYDIADSYNLAESADIQPDNIELPFDSILLNLELNNLTTRKISRRSADRHKTLPLANSYDQSSIIRNSGKPRFHNLQKQLIEFDTKQFECSGKNKTECFAKMNAFKNILMKEFHRMLMLENNAVKNNPNRYSVQPNSTAFVEKSGAEMLCELKRLDVRTITSVDAPFAANGFKSVIPVLPLLKNKFFESCAVVASSGALLHSDMGRFIDSHSLVLRFNHAPVVNFTKDVGSKTTIRIINSQVVSKKKYNFVASKLYRNISLLAWDPSNYTSTLYRWYKKPDFNLFPNYKKFQRRNRGADFHLLNPRSLWRLWDFMQENLPYKLRRNPPSSGFLGLAVLLPHCGSIDMIEYVPSTRLSRRCHYYDPDDGEDGAACTFGAWHPLAAEKMIAYRMKANSDWDIFRSGILRINGTRGLKC